MPSHPSKKIIYFKFDKFDKHLPPPQLKSITCLNESRLLVLNVLYSACHLR